jgi:transglutaminase-like putative cysteine protease
MKWVVLLLLILPSVLATTPVFDADKATLELIIDGRVEFIGSGSVHEASAELSWIPRNTYNQKTEYFTTEPAANIGDVAKFAWENPALGVHFLRGEALISTNNGITPVTEKIAFPIEYVEPELYQYTQPSTMIDVTPEINQLAGMLAGEKDDLYEVVFTLADWVTTNIEYDLNTLTAEAVYPSSWVLDERRGVCDEMTNLFISLNRALGMGRTWMGRSIFP